MTGNGRPTEPRRSSRASHIAQGLFLLLLAVVIALAIGTFWLLAVAAAGADLWINLVIAALLLLPAAMVIRGLAHLRSGLRRSPPRI